MTSLAIRLPRAFFAAIGAFTETLWPAPKPIGSAYFSVEPDIKGFREKFSAASVTADCSAEVSADPHPVPSAELTTSELLSRSAHIIEGWRHLLLRPDGPFDGSVTDFIAELRSRAARFAAIPRIGVVETGHDIGLTHAAEMFPQHTRQ